MAINHYIGQLVLVYIDGNHWELDEPFGYCTKAGEIIMIPQGHKSDLASVPPVFRWLLPKAGAGQAGGYGRAAVIHDWIVEHPWIWCREYGDNILMECMKLDKVALWRRELIYHACATYTYWTRNNRLPPLMFA